MSLRTRLALAAAAAVAAAVVLASVIVYFVVRNELSGQVNRNLGAQASRIAQVGFFRFAATSQPKVFVLGTGPQFRFGDNYFQLVDATGSIYRPDDPRLASITLPATQHAEEVAARTKAQFYSESSISGQHVRIFTMPLARGPAIPGQPASPQLAVQVVSSLASLDHELSKIKLWLILVAIGGTGLAAGAGLPRRAVRLAAGPSSARHRRTCTQRPRT